MAGHAEPPRPRPRPPSQDGRDKTVAYVKDTADDLYGHAGPPVFKVLDGYQWILLLSGHAARHTAQIDEVKAVAGYPAK